MDKRTRVVVDNRIRVEVQGPADPVSVELKEQSTHDNPAYRTWKTFRMGAPPDKQVCTWRTEQRGRVVTVPRGRLPEVLRLLARHGRAWAVDDRTVCPASDFGDTALEQPLWPHQEHLLESFLPECPGVVDGLWRAPQGSGKTQAVLALALRLRTRVLVVVSTSALFEQWCIRIQRDLGMRPGRVQGKHRDVRPITVGMVQTLVKCAPELADQFGFVCLDEVQQAASVSFQDVVDCFPARYRLGVSGDERRADKKEFLIYDTFGPVSCEVTRAEVEHAGQVVDVEVRVVPTDFRADWYVALGADDPHDERQRVQAARDKVMNRVRLLEELTNDEARNELVIAVALSAASPSGSIASEQFVILSDRREQCLRLDSMLAARGVRSGLFIGGADYAQQFELTLAGMKTHELLAGVGTYKAIGVGFEASRELSIGVCASPCVFNDKSRMQFNQYRGRFARSAPGKVKGFLYYLWDRHVYGINPVRLLCRWNKTVKVQTPEGWVEGKRFLQDA